MNFWLTVTYLVSSSGLLLSHGAVIGFLDFIFSLQYLNLHPWPWPSNGLDRFKVNQQPTIQLKGLLFESCGSHTHTNTHALTDCYTWTTEVVCNEW